MEKKTVIKNQEKISQLLALGAIIGPVLLTLAWLVLGLLVSPLHTEYGIQGGVSGTITSPISGIGVGPNAFLFNTAFVLSGLLTIIGVLGVFQLLKGNGRPIVRWVNATLLSLSPLGFIIAGVFTIADSVPLHMVGFLLVAGTPVFSFLVAGLYFRGIPGWRRFGNWLLLGSPLTLLLTVLFIFVSFDKDVIAAGEGIAGIPSRLLVLEIGAWYVAMGWLARRHSSNQSV